MTNSEPQPSILRQADIEGVDISDLPTLIDLDNDEMLTDDPLPLSLTPQPPVHPTSSTFDNSA